MPNDLLSASTFTADLSLVSNRLHGESKTDKRTTRLLSPVHSTLVQLASLTGLVGKHLGCRIDAVIQSIRNTVSGVYLCRVLPPSDCRMHLSVYLQDSLVREVTISSPEGCHITPCSPEEKHFLQPGSPEVVPLPVDSLSALRRGDECPTTPPSPSALERGVLLWMGPDGLYARRLCQSRVYWQGGLSQYGDKPNKLEREVNCKLLHTQDLLTGKIAAPTKKYVTCFTVESIYYFSSFTHILCQSTSLTYVKIILFLFLLHSRQKSLKICVLYWNYLISSLVNNTRTIIRLHGYVRPLRLVCGQGTELDSDDCHLLYTKTDNVPKTPLK